MTPEELIEAIDKVIGYCLDSEEKDYATYPDPDHIVYAFRKLAEFADYPVIDLRQR